jgi:hypothetical protein
MFSYYEINKDAREWNNELLLKYYEVVLSNIHNNKYLVDVTGFDTAQFAIKKFYHVRREIETRGLDVSKINDRCGNV